MIVVRRIVGKHADKYQFVFKPLTVLYPESWFYREEVSIFAYTEESEANRLLDILREKEESIVRLVENLYNVKAGIERRKPLAALERFWKTCEKAAGIAQ